MYEIIAKGSYSPLIDDHIIYFDNVDFVLADIREFIEETGFDVIIKCMQCQEHFLMDDYQFLFASQEELILFQMYFKI